MSRAASASGEVYLHPGERDELLAEVDKCDREADSARGRDQQQLLALLEKGLYLRRRLYAESSTEVMAACRRVCEACNQAATNFLLQGNLKSAHELLKRAEQVAEKSDIDRAITWNNLACYYRRTGKLRAAASLLERALAIEEYVRDADAAQTHLNLCATLSQLQRHGDALYHAQSALIHMYEILSQQMIAGKLSGSVAEEQVEQVQVLCIAYHNMAVEQEYLKNYDASICAFVEGMRWATRFLPEGHQLVGILKESVMAVKGKLAPHSGSLRRANELLEQTGKTDGKSAGKPSDGMPLHHLVTPRGTGEHGEEPADRAGKEAGSEELSGSFAHASDTVGS
mmetsp:Transcript_59929/g.104833  ORF Transcript_59929/g.104833 Transcript_59929/m.104833 type:complete len:341 (-) Transcript_59929:92-1114(-)